MCGAASCQCSLTSIHLAIFPIVVLHAFIQIRNCNDALSCCQCDSFGIGVAPCAFICDVCQWHVNVFSRGAFFLNNGLFVETNQISVSGSLSMSYYLSLWLPVQYPLRLEVTDSQLL